MLLPRPRTRARLVARLALVSSACAALLLTLPARAVRAGAAPTGRHGVALIKIAYSDSASTTYTAEQLDQAAGEMRQFFQELSYGGFDPEIRFTSVTLTGAVADYWIACPRPEAPDARCARGLAEAAIAAANTAGFSFSGVGSVLLLSPCGIEGDVAYPGRVTVPGVTGRFAHAYDFECGSANPNPPGPSRVWWGAWAHELGHLMEQEGGGLWGHPGGYSSGYDLMDSCYPCHESGFGVSGPAVLSNTGKAPFPGWLADAEVVTIEAPRTGSVGRTVVLEPLSAGDPTSTAAPRVIKIPLNSAATYLVVNARRRLNTDTRNVGPGIWDEGVELLTIDEGRVVSGWEAPVTVVSPCDMLPDGCVRMGTDPRNAICRTAPGVAAAPFCWPFTLWHPGETYTDTTNNITVRVDRAEVAPGFSVTVTRGVPPGRPDVFLIPWLTPPMNAYETVDIWVDSSCNGYESDPLIGRDGLRLGRRADGSVIGNGDSPCVNHDNRIYAKIRNGGDAAARNVQVHFKVTEPLGVGITGPEHWRTVGTAARDTFRDLGTLAAGATTEVYAVWRPEVTLTEEQIRERRFAFHSCVQVVVDASSDEAVPSNQDGNGEQENIDFFEVRRDRVASTFDSPVVREFFLRNPFIADQRVLLSRDVAPAAREGKRPFFLAVDSELPRDWRLSVGTGDAWLNLDPNEVRPVPVRLEVPPGTPIGQTYQFEVEAFTPKTLSNPAAPADSPYARHTFFQRVAGVLLSAHTVYKTDLNLSAQPSADGKQIQARGALKPAIPRAVVAIDYTSPGGKTQTHTVRADDNGTFTDSLPGSPGEWIVRALWQGDKENSSAVSEAVRVRLGGDEPQAESQQLPAGSQILTTPVAFEEGVLTGYVIGPDDQPLADVPIEVSGGDILTGVVVADAEPEKKDQPQQPTPRPTPGKGQQARTDKNGRFVLTVAPGAGKVGVAVPGLPPAEVPVVKDLSPNQAPPDPPDNVKPGERITVTEAYPNAQFEQGGKQGQTPVATAVTKNGKRGISSLRVPRSILPGVVRWRFKDAKGQFRAAESRGYRTIRAWLDRKALHTSEGASFGYEMDFGADAAGSNVCVSVTLGGPVRFVKAPDPQVRIGPDGRVSWGGRIQAQQIAPGTEIPFSITPAVRRCGGR